jgi:drug/metabolite transporter (DMT)-like permease
LNIKSNLYSLIAICIWSSLELAGKLLGEGISPFAITAWRFLIGGAVILPFAILQGTRNKVKLNIGSILTLGALGILNVVVSMLLLQLAIYYGKASLTAIIVSMNPLFVSLFAYLILSERLSSYHIFSILMGVVGLIIIIMGERDYTSSNFVHLPTGVFFAILAAITFALYTVLTKKAIQKYGNRITNCASFLIGGISLSIINAVIGKSMRFDPTLTNLSLMLYLGIVITGVAYLFYFEAMKTLTAARASIYFFLKPAIASFLAFLFLGEHLSWIQIMGIVLIMLALSRRFWLKRI